MNTKWDTMTEYERGAFKTWVKGLLTTEVVTITFIKADGTERVMKATLKEDAIPVSDNKTGRTRAPNDEVVSVVDTEIGEWRSIRFDSIKQLRFTLE